MFRVTVWKSGITRQYEVDLVQLRREVAAFLDDDGVTAFIIHRIRGDQE